MIYDIKRIPLSVKKYKNRYVLNKNKIDFQVVESQNCV